MVGRAVGVGGWGRTGAVGLAAVGASAITDIEEWLQARDATMIFWAEGTLMAAQGLADGAEITTTDPWTDESGNGYDADPQDDVGGSRPLYRDGTTTQIYSNGKPAIEFDGDQADVSASHALITGQVAAPDRLSSPYTVLSIGRTYGYEAVGIFHDGWQNANKSALAWPQSTTNVDVLHTDQFTSGGGENVTAPGYFGPQSMVAVYDSDRTIYVNGYEVATPATGLNTSDNEGLTLGGKNPDGSYSTRDGWLSLVAVIPGEISITDVRAFAAWATRYGCPDWSSGAAEVSEMRRVGTDNGTVDLVFPSTPVEGDLLIAYTTSSQGSVDYTEHTCTDGGTAWTLATGVDITESAATVGSGSIWYKIAESSQPTTVTIGNSVGGGVTGEVRVVKNVSTLVQTRSADAGAAGTFSLHAFNSVCAVGNWLLCVIVYDGADPGIPTNWSGGWHGTTHDVRIISGSKKANTASTQAGIVSWPNSDGYGFMLAEFS